jgi:hypothetical protein
MGGIAAALKKKNNASVEKPSGMGMGMKGVASAAAAAALKKQNNALGKKPFGIGMGMGMGGIAAAAAAAALKKKEVNDEDDEKAKRGTTSTFATESDPGQKILRNAEAHQVRRFLKLREVEPFFDFGSLDAFASKCLNLNDINSSFHSNPGREGQMVTLVIGGKVCKEGFIIAKDSKYYTIQIPVEAFKDGKIVIDKSVIGEAADGAARAQFENQGELIVPLSQDGYHQRNAGDKVNNRASDAASIIDKAKNDREETGPQNNYNSLGDEEGKDRVAGAAEVIAKAKESNSEIESKLEDTLFKDDPEYEKFFKMLKMGLPMGAVKNALTRDGKDPSIMDLDPNKSIKSQMKSDDDEEKDTGPALKDDPEYEKFFKMLKMGLPMGAVKNALTRDGKDPSIMDLDPNKSIKSQIKSDDDEEEEDTGPALKDDPEYEKFFKMLKMGLPMGAVKNALQRDGKDPSIMDLDPNKSMKGQTKKKKKKKKKLSKTVKKEKKPKVRRKKIYWNAIDKSKVQKDSLWGKIRGMVGMEKLMIDTSEFESLFTETLDPSQKKKKKASADNDAAKPKKSVQVIEGKRGMNGGIILARLKMDFKELAQIVNHM